MNKIKITIISLLFLFLCINLYANNIKIIIKVQNEIITNIDIRNEIKYLLFLNPKLENLKLKQIKNIAKDSLVTEIVKRKELEKFYSFENMDTVLKNIEARFLKNNNISDRSEFIKILNDKELSYDTIKKKLHIEALWNQLIFDKYSSNIKINKDDLRKNILIQFKNENKKYEYNLSEIFFSENVNETLDETLAKLKTSINEIGFENTANIYSISSTSKNGGLIGWVNELQISQDIKKNINNLNENEISVPIKIGGGYLIIKLNSKKEFKEEIDIESQLKSLINKEKNRQLNTFSIIFYKRLKKNIQIDEL